MSEHRPADPDRVEALIIGGGPAGLTAALYLARYRRNALVLDAGNGRCAWIPRSHNHPGFPDGIPGPELLQRIRDQAERYGAVLHHDSVEHLSRDPDSGLFTARGTDGRAWHTPHVLLATGVEDLEPDLPDLFDAVRRGLIRHCPICDAWEARGERIAVLGHGSHGAREALFLRDYSPHITLLTGGIPAGLSAGEEAALAAAGIGVDTRPVRAVRRTGDRITAFTLGDGGDLSFDTLYSALGCRPRTGLAKALGLATAEDGRLRTDEHQQTDIPGLYAAGDITPGLNQIVRAMGQAATAATAIHNRMRILPPPA